MTNEEITALNKAVCKSLGIHWHKWKYIAGFGLQCDCGLDLYGKDNHTYRQIIPVPAPLDFTTQSGRIQLLTILKKREDWSVFTAWTEIEHLHNLDFKGDTYFIDTSYLLDLEPNFNPRLAEAWIKFWEEKK